MLLLEAILLINMMSEDYTLFSQHIAHDSYNVKEDDLKGFVPRHSTKNMDLNQMNL